MQKLIIRGLSLLAFSMIGIHAGYASMNDSRTINGVPVNEYVIDLCQNIEQTELKITKLSLQIEAERERINPIIAPLDEQASFWDRAMWDDYRKHPNEEVTPEQKEALEQRDKNYDQIEEVQKPLLQMIDSNEIHKKELNALDQSLYEEFTKNPRIYQEAAEAIEQHSGTISKSMKRYTYSNATCVPISSQE
jgi:hypothetical protein